MLNCAAANVKLCAKKICKMEDVEIISPLVTCGRRMANLQQNEYVEIETNLKKQQLFSIISLVAFGIAVILMIMWAVPTPVPMAAPAKVDPGQPAPAGFMIDWISGTGAEKAANQGMFIAALVCGLDFRWCSARCSRR